MSAEIGAIVPGTVVRIAPYGAFIRLETGETGLVHISEIDRNYVRSVEEHLRIDDQVTEGPGRQGGRQDRPVHQAGRGRLAARGAEAARRQGPRVRAEAQAVHAFQ